MKCLTLAATISLGLLLGLCTPDAHAQTQITLQVNVTITAPGDGDTFYWYTSGSTPHPVQVQERATHEIIMDGPANTGIPYGYWYTDYECHHTSTLAGGAPTLYDTGGQYSGQGIDLGPTGHWSISRQTQQSCNYYSVTATIGVDAWTDVTVYTNGANSSVAAHKRGDDGIDFNVAPRPY